MRADSFLGQLMMALARQTPAFRAEPGAGHFREEIISALGRRGPAFKPNNQPDASRQRRRHMLEDASPGSSPSTRDKADALARVAEPDDPEQVEEAGRTDGKTGLLNAAAWQVRAERVLKLGKDDGPHGVLVLDLDNFKVINDSHGHVAGDHVLGAIANALRAEVRERDLVGRFGGDEFVVLLTGLGNGADRALNMVAERISRRIADMRVEIPTPDGPRTVTALSVAIGGAVTSTEDPDLQSVLQVADGALYAAKRTGRNLVRVLPTPSPSPSSAPPASGQG